MEEKPKIHCFNFKKNFIAEFKILFPKKGDFFCPEIRNKLISAKRGAKVC